MENFRKHIASIGVREIASSDREEWQDQRLSGIGGSDLTNLVDGDDYACARKLYYSKTTENDYDGSDWALRRGRRLEPIAREYYQEKSGRIVMHGFGALVQDSHEHRRVNVDGIVLDKELGYIVTEFKVLGEDSFNKIKKIGLPKSYLAQAQWAAGLLGIKHTSYGIYQPLSDELLVIDMPFDGEVFSGLCELVDSAWILVQKKSPPIQLPPESFACRTCEYRKTCKGLLSNGKVSKR